MNQQKETSKAGSSFVSSLPAASGVKETEFLGYETLEAESKILVLWKNQERIDVAKESEEIFIACASTPFMQKLVDKLGILVGLYQARQLVLF